MQGHIIKSCGKNLARYYNYYFIPTTFAKWRSKEDKSGDILHNETFSRALLQNVASYSILNFHSNIWLRAGTMDILYLVFNSKMLEQLLENI